MIYQRVLLKTVNCLRRRKKNVLRTKHGKRPIPFSTYELPFHAIDYCLGVAGIHINDVDHFAYSFDPYILLGKDHNGSDTIKLPLKPTESS